MYFVNPKIKNIKIFLIFYQKTLDKIHFLVYNILVRQREKPLRKGSEGMNEMNVTQALLKAILELIEKCETLEELRERVKRIMSDEK